MPAEILLGFVTSKTVCPTTIPVVELTDVKQAFAVDPFADEEVTPPNATKQFVVQSN